MQIKLIDGKPHHQVTVWQEIEFPSDGDFRRARFYKRGQLDREAGRPCASTHGTYLEGWRNPGIFPPFFTVAQSHAWYAAIEPATDKMIA